MVKGKTKPIGVYEILDFHTDESFPNMHEVINHFRAGLEAYREGDFKRAIPQFNESLELHSGDEVSRMYVQRCQHLLDNPPEEDWSGVWVMNTK